MGKTIVVVGGSFAGLQVSHKLLKQTVPSQKNLKVILVSKSTHFYWNIAAPRAIIPGALKPEEFFQPIEPGFASYSKDNFELIIGAATALDPSAKTITVAAASTEPRVLSYDYLVLASGARSPTEDVLWKNPGTYEEGTAKIRDINEKVRAAQSFVVGGAGMTGVETASELAAEYKDKEVVLISADSAILGGDATAAAAESQITKLGVKVRKGVKVTGSSQAADGKTEVSLSDGNKILTDLYIPTVGLVPNSEYIPAALLTDRGYLAVDEQFRAKGHENIWGTGDLVSIPRASFAITDKQTAGVFQNVDAAIKGKPQTPVKGMPFDVMLVSTGRKSGVGRLGVVNLPSFMIWGMKSRNLATNMMGGYASGSKW
ncbi:hypothetical protein F5X68DRAFT_250611 [Plectosphaerella plurivora]|uniref:FAD/NAD(P)-binding domain-containing protein n=1 Tax=Plectosphaerella plurivora TaxID=936078 RepID=A0A9P8VH91_9PEZI|nr:hypothetical protein F5X68DRAFT_250611 [Plectosphaerella plurivora]